ncbi:aminotransferase [Enterococcus mundtii]|uniref:aminotransferase class V-fold PLP-dependent enzyme n=1 Tax=Enterococcus mundtii TaxID=53346 RepID=UPI000D3D3AF6|nr:aminotransferase class V-fold PLP-dependent enzyme [Enterococcus mundtii]PTO38655.1 aminotransferase [Enterococcus mundtii]PTO41501.1 aminotransferase [Enterococcus mundtii]
MKEFPLKSLSIEEAMELQFKLVDSITNHFPGDEILTRGDLGVVKGLNQPKTTNKVEKVLADFFNAEATMLVRGSGTNAIRLALHTAIGTGNTLLVHNAPVYPTTQVSINMLGINLLHADFNDLNHVTKIINENKIDGILIQVTRQKIDDSYDLSTLISHIRSLDERVPIITDDNYSALKTEGIGTQFGGTLACFSTFKLLGPEGIGCIVGEKTAIEHLKTENYSGGGQVQGHESIDVLRGMIYAPVSFAISAKVGEEVRNRINNHEVDGMEEAFIVNAQSKVIVVKLTEPIAKKVIEAATKFGGLPNPVGAESKYEFSPLIYRISGTFREADPNAENTMIRINPNRAGSETIISILKKAMGSI